MLIFDTRSVAMVRNGARLLATAQSLDPETMENIIRRSVAVAREAVLLDLRAASGNDKD